MPGLDRKIGSGSTRANSSAGKMERVLFAVLTAVLVITGVFADRKAQASGDVDLVLVLALDVSDSVDATEYQLMSEGLANALSSSLVEQAIRAGKHGAIAISVVQWSGFQEQVVKIKWTRVADHNDLVDLAGEVRRMTRRYNGGATDIGGALKFSTELVNSAPFQTARRVIDLAGDGPNNVNLSPDFERDIAVKSGVTINGLAIIADEITLFEFYTRFVIGGQAAFVENAQNYDGFERAMRRKLLREIGSLYLF
jgi:hypothetical protein